MKLMYIRTVPTESMSGVTIFCKSSISTIAKSHNGTMQRHAYGLLSCRAADLTLGMYGYTLLQFVLRGK